ncbi:MAG: sigma-E factor negative regulatory protein [Burkholderiales bacterium]|nr:sigma-E factor negative regulatory protein [Burkholderiales bacterium]
MVTKTNADLSDMMDGELSDAQIDQMLMHMHTDPALRQSWDAYHLAGDAIASDDLAMKMSDDFMANLTARLEQEPVVLAPKQMPTQSPAPQLSGSKISLSLALTSIAATVTLALLMAPQIAPLLQNTPPSTALVKHDSQDASFSTQIKLANNSNTNSSTNGAPGASAGNRDAEFAPRLENQVEMLRDPRLDSYLLAHQKASPTLDNGGRYIKRANVTASSDNEK